MTSTLEERLRGVLEGRYHHRHPFNVLMHAGRLSREQLQLWVSNRYYYQTRIPLKDALILAKSEDPEFRRLWLHRLQDHDGTAPDQGGLELWLALAEAVGLPRESVRTSASVEPRVREVCDRYVELVRNWSLTECVAASLTESLAGPLMQQRLEAWERSYPWVDPRGLEYFRRRVTQAPRDAAEALGFLQRHATTPELEQVCEEALAQKCRILWELLDAVYAAGISGCRPRLTARARLKWDDVRRTHVLLGPEKALLLNGTAADVAVRCTGELTFAEIGAELSRKYAGSAGADPVGEAASFIAALQVRTLLELDSP